MKSMLDIRKKAVKFAKSVLTSDELDELPYDPPAIYLQ